MDWIMATRPPMEHFCAYSVRVEWTPAEIKRRRDERGLSQDRLGRLLADYLNMPKPVARRTIVNWETGKAEPRGRNLRALERVLGDDTNGHAKVTLEDASFLQLLAEAGRRNAELEAEVAALRAELAAHRPPRNIRLPTERLKMYSPDARDPATPGSGQAGETDDRAL